MLLRYFILLYSCYFNLSLIHYNLEENLLEYADNEKDLGVDITSNFSYNGHCDKIIYRAN